MEWVNEISVKSSIDWVRNSYFRQTVGVVISIITCGARVPNQENLKHTSPSVSGGEKNELPRKWKWRMKTNSCCHTSTNLRSVSIFVVLCKIHSSGQGETKREPGTDLLRNVFHPLFWLIDICRISQPKLLPLLVILVCKFFIRGKNVDSLTWKIAFIF